VADFSSAYERLLRAEGGYRETNVAGDRGDHTWAGISRRYHPNWKGWELVDSGAADTDELVRLTHRFYKENYWDGFRGDDMGSQEIAEHLLVASVLSGLATVVKMAQTLLEVDADGIFGQKTLEAVQGLGSQEKIDRFVLSFCLLRIFRYNRLAGDPRQLKFLRGWIRRVENSLKGD